MSEIETLGILEDIASLVSDHLQVVSYKWLSRNFSVSSNAAKKLLHEFVEKHKNDSEVVYTVAGWLKNAPQTYHIRLVPGTKLSEAKHDFDGNCSVQVYSVQASIPKDPAAIWNAEFIQAEELFKQPISVDNCLRDNRFCGVSNSFVKRNAEGESIATAVPQTKSAGPPGQGIGSPANRPGSSLQIQPKKLDQAIPNSALQSSNVTTSRIKIEQPNTSNPQNKESEKDKNSLPIKKKGQSDKSSAGTGSSLANLWGRASSKPKMTNSAMEDKCVASKANGVSDSADAQISARENLEAASSEDDETGVNFKRANDGGKKRRVVFDDSDEEDDEIAVNLGSPDVPNGKSLQDSRQKSLTSDIEKTILKFEEQEDCEPMSKEEDCKPMTKEKDCKPMTKEEESNDDAKPYAKEEFAALYMGKNVKNTTSGKIHKQTPDDETSNKIKAAEAAPSPPKRRKVLKTRIDERGREVTEVVWEGEEVDEKNSNAKKSSEDTNAKNANVKNANGNTEKIEEKGAANPVIRTATTTKKSPAAGSTAPSLPAGKGGSKKGANSKDPKQGNILSFFKKV